MAYLLDANVFIQAKNLHYGMDFCPAFWDWLVREHAAEKILSIANRELTTRFEQKIQTALARIWGEEKEAAETVAM